MQTRQIHKLIFKKLLFFFSIFLIITGCAKEYSYEGGGSSIILDTIPVPPVVPEFSVCPACITTTTTQLSDWKFKSGNSSFCGKADTAIINPFRNAFTFFGPSACSLDTGIVIRVYLENDTLNRDKSNLSAKGSFYYYDNITPSYIFINRSSNLLSVTIESYEHLTRIATGTFQGTVVRANGSGALIKEGKFKVKII